MKRVGRLLYIGFWAAIYAAVLCQGFEVINWGIVVGPSERQEQAAWVRETKRWLAFYGVK